MIPEAHIKNGKLLVEDPEDGVWIVNIDDFVVEDGGVIYRHRVSRPAYDEWVTIRINRHGHGEMLHTISGCGDVSHSTFRFEADETAKKWIHNKLSERSVMP